MTPGERVMVVRGQQWHEVSPGIYQNELGTRIDELSLRALKNREVKERRRIFSRR